MSPVKKIISNLFDLKSKMDQKKIESEKKVQEEIEDFIPYSCLWDKDTIITKNSEVLQIIKITGFSRESIGSEKTDLIELVRKSLINNVKDDKCAFWFHTIRRKKDLEIGGDYPMGFSEDLNNAWKNANNWSETFVNEVYITVIMEGSSASFFDGKIFFKSLFSTILKKNQKNHINDSVSRLTNIVDKMLQTLSSFGAKRLTIYKKDNQYFSEQMSFLYKLLNLEDKEIKVSDTEISNEISNKGLKVDFNSLEVLLEDSSKFGTVFTFKEYIELPGSLLDKFMQLPNEFVLTQTLDFVSRNQALEGYKEARNYMEAGKDDELARLSRLEDIIENDTGSDVDYGESQITIFIFDKDKETLEKNAIKIANIFNEIGIIAPRRDVRLEECFWAQMPANFSFISRQKPISTALVAGFCTLFNYPVGKRYFNKWGPAVCMFHAYNETPFFFNFHVEDNGHTAIIGPKNGGKTLITNFMVSEARKFNCNIYYFETNDRSKGFIKALSGRSVSVKFNNDASNSEHFSFNPFNLVNSEKNIEFLKEFVILMADLAVDNLKKKDTIKFRGEIENVKYLLKEDEKKIILASVGHLMSLSQDERNIDSFMKYITDNSDEELVDKLSAWGENGGYYNMFNNDVRESDLFDEKIVAFFMRDVINSDIEKIPTLLYLFHKLESSLNGSPTLIVLNKAWDLVNNKVFASRLSRLLERLKLKNALVIFATEATPNDKDNAMTNAIVSSIATKIFLPNLDADKASSAYKEVWGLESEEYETLSKIRPELRQFMLKQDEKALIGNLNLEGIKEAELLSTDSENVKIIEESIKAKGSNPSDWLPVFYEKVAKKS